MSGIEEKYISVRNRLDAFGYKAPLGVESIPLVERLFADLVHTTESLKKSRISRHSDFTNSQNPKIELESTIEPFRQDNSRLMTENNELHKNMSAMREKVVETSGQFQQKARKLQNENSDLRFLNSQYLTKIKHLEKESFAKSEKLRKLQEKNMATIVTSPGGTKRSSGPRRQRITIDHTLPFSSYKAPPLPAANDLYIADVLKIAEKRCLNLEEEIKQIRNSKTDSENRIKYVRKQKEIVEAENDRLRAQLTGGRPEAAISIESASRQSDKVISQLTMQLEISQESQIEAEENVEKLKLELNELKNTNDKLKSELNEIGQMATVLEQERQTAVAKANSNSTLVQKETFQRKIRDLENDLEEYAKKLGKEIENKNRLELRLAQIEPSEDYVNLKKEKDFYQEAYRKMSSRQPLTDEILSEQQITNIIDERDSIKSKLIQLERKYAETGANLKVVQQERDRCEIRFGQVNDELAQLRRETIQTNPKSQKESNLAQTAILKRIQTERDSALADLRRISCERDSLLEQVKINRENQLCDTVTLEQKVEDLEGRSRILENERKDLLLTNSSQKTKIETLQQELESLTFNYQNAQIELSQIKADIDEIRILRTQSEQLQRDGSRNILKLRSDLESEKEKNEALENRINLLVQNSNDINDEISKLKIRITSLDRDKDALTIALDDKSERLAELEMLNKQNDLTNGESKHQIIKLHQEIELLQDQIDDLERKESHNRKLLDEKRSIENELLNSREKANRQKRELTENVNLLSNENEKLSRELQIVLDQRNESKTNLKENETQVLALQSELTQTRRENGILTEKVIQFENQQTILENDLLSKNEENEKIKNEKGEIDQELNIFGQRNVQLENEIVQHLEASENHEGQIIELSKTVRKLEGLIIQVRQENSVLTVAVEGARELNAKLQSNADQSTREIALHINQSQNQESMSDDLRSQILLEKQKNLNFEETIYTLENTLRQLREQHFQKDIIQSEIESDRDLLTEKVNLAESRCLQADNELIDLRTEMARHQNEVESLQRQITDLKFQNEKSNQHLRRLQNQTQ